MQQSWNMSPFAMSATGGVRAASPEAQAVRRYGLIFGLLNGLFATLQVAISSSAALENHAAISSLYYGFRDQTLDPSVAVAWLTPVLASAYGSCLVAFGFGMWLCWQAGRATALAAGRDAGGASVGMLTSLIGSGVWIAVSVVATIVLHTDGTASGVLASTPDRSAANLGGELFGLLTQEVVGGLVALGFGAVAGRIGAGSVRFPARSAPPATFAPLYAATIPLPPHGYPAAGVPMPSYPPLPDFYRGLPQAPSQQFGGGWPSSYPGGAAYPPAYPAQPFYAPYPPPAPYPGAAPLMGPAVPPAGGGDAPAPASQPPASSYIAEPRTDGADGATGDG
jgi:hypothetical protein